MGKTKGQYAKLLESVQALRKIYETLSMSKKKRYVQKNSSLLVDILELEELLLETGVIDVSDVIKMSKKLPSTPGKPEVRLDQSYKKIGPIFKQFLVENNLYLDFGSVWAANQLSGSPQGKVMGSES